MATVQPMSVHDTKETTASRTKTKDVAEDLRLQACHVRVQERCAPL
jgi:hypothetical protein